MYNKEKKRKYYEKNRVALIDWQKRYYREKQQNNAEYKAKLKKYCHEYYLKNKEKLKNKDYEKNIEYVINLFK